MNLSVGNKCFLEYLVHATKGQRITLLKTVSINQLRLLTEIIYNTLRGNVQLDAEVKNTLKRRKTQLRKVILKTLSRSNRRRHIINIQNSIPLLIKAYLKHESRANINSKAKVRQLDGRKERIRRKTIKTD